MGIEEKNRDLTSSQGRKSFFSELVRVAAFSFLAILTIRYFLFKPFYVKGASMEPTYFEHEYLIIDELTYRFHNPDRGEVVVFRPPGNTRDFYIKRVIGLQGETVKFVNGDVIVFNKEHPSGFKLDESIYLQTDIKQNETVVMKLGTEEYFVLGDNRMVSSDSRRFGPIKRDAIVGRVLLRGWPLDRFGFMHHTPHYTISDIK